MTLDYDAIDAQLRTAPPGTVIEYFRGELSRTRALLNTPGCAHFLEQPEAEARRAVQTADLAVDLAREGRVSLVQFKMRPLVKDRRGWVIQAPVFAYRAIVSHPRKERAFA